ncbi:acyl-CoA dehydrogenase [Streptomyces sp. SAI-135]|jgi:acyl-CoA dehydrogenase|uniref:acyl-CoA dehydrogenase family protein n=1 Tax=unclassified Streptomyces TaxID=2593676 RepID=UPI002475EA2A|nr:MULTISPECIES: acyl-CoA dehydrogenase family protein [unclassified Streptomyces]MDH6521936.1 acyl-CoA dehydrogenase [Streptomyces sp. SAI-090]MDH6573305.1 acyl-CoA dehydrogenase [Streptomyces sp. SAI-117]MDH6613962.1 acyl-CoA dehydrogenase [Streptomyces sp. SAI-135]
MDFSFDKRTEELRENLAEFLRSRVIPAERHFAEPHFGPDDAEVPGAPATGWGRPAVMAELRAEARDRGLWNLFLPHSPLGAGLSNLQYAPLAEITGWSPQVAPEALNCAAPDTGNMELLSMFATDEQRERWLEPLLDARIRSAYCMTEPGVASSDASTMRLTARREGDEYVLNGRKWWATGALAPECALLVVLAVTDPDAPPRDRQSIFLVPADTEGVRVVRGLSVFGFTDAAHGGHGEVVFDNVRVPATHLLGGEGEGARLAQARLGPGRIHHCMRLVGMAERALELMCARAEERTAFGRPLAEHGEVLAWIAEARVRIDQLRLLVLRAAWLIDEVGAREARTEISAIKVAAPRTAEWVVDRAIQTHGAAGMAQDLPLALLWAQARGLRFADGPDEVHRMVLGRRELARQRERAQGAGGAR